MIGLVAVGLIIGTIGSLPSTFAYSGTTLDTIPGKNLLETARNATPLIAVKDQRVFVFNPRKNRWYAYQNGRLVKSGVASGGANYCADIKRSCRTPSGTYKVRWKGGPGCKSGRYPLPNGGAPMGYCIFYSKYYAIHASNSVPKNRNASHGCIRVYKNAAKWLNRNFLRVGDTVIVKRY